MAKGCPCAMPSAYRKLSTADAEESTRQVRAAGKWRHARRLTREGWLLWHVPVDWTGERGESRRP